MSRPGIDIRRVVCPACGRAIGTACGMDPERGAYNHRRRADAAMQEVVEQGIEARGGLVSPEQQRRLAALAPRLVDAGLRARGASTGRSEEP